MLLHGLTFNRTTWRLADLKTALDKQLNDAISCHVIREIIVNGGIALARAEAFRAIGGFDVSLRYCEDWHCWCRLAAIGEFEFAPNLLLDYRLHTANTMNAAVRTPQDFFPAIARVFDDGLIMARLPAGTAAGLRRAAEVHLVTYSAMQAVRFGRYRQAFAYLEQAYQAHAMHFCNLKVEPTLDPLRSDPRFANLLWRVGLHEDA